MGIERGRLVDDRGRERAQRLGGHAFDIGALAARGVARGLLAGFEPAACNEDETDQDRGGLHGRISKSWSRSALPGTIRMQSMSFFSGMPGEPVRREASACSTALPSWRDENG